MVSLCKCRHHEFDIARRVANLDPSDVYCLEEKSVISRQLQLIYLEVAPR